MIECLALVKIVDLDDHRFLSEDLSKPGTEPLFLINIRSGLSSADYVTDGRLFWMVVTWYFPTIRNAPRMRGLELRVFGDDDGRMTIEDINETKEAIKLYAEAL